MKDKINSYQIKRIIRIIQLLPFITSACIFMSFIFNLFEIKPDPSPSILGIVTWGYILFGISYGFKNSNIFCWYHRTLLSTQLIFAIYDFIFCVTSNNVVYHNIFNSKYWNVFFDCIQYIIILCFIWASVKLIRQEYIKYLNGEHSGKQ